MESCHAATSLADALAGLLAGLRLRKKWAPGTLRCTGANYFGEQRSEGGGSSDTPAMGIFQDQINIRERI